MQYYLDPIKDVFNVQLRMRTSYFGKKESSTNGDKFSTFTNNELLNMDNILEYTYKGVYMENVIQMMHKEFKNLNFIRDLMQSLHFLEETETLSSIDYIKFKLYFILTYFNQIPKLIGYMSQKDFYKFILKRFFTNDEQKRLERITLYKKDFNRDNSISLQTCIKLQIKPNQFQYYILTGYANNPFKIVDSIDTYMVEHNLKNIKDSFIK